MQMGIFCFYWDIPDQNSVAVEWAKQHGFTAQRPLIRMYRSVCFYPSQS